jgi:hypothetical protein
MEGQILTAIVTLNGSGWAIKYARCIFGNKGFESACVLTCRNLLILSPSICDYGRSLDWWIYLLTTYTHHSQLQLIIALSLIFTLYKSAHHSLSLFWACCVFISRFLATTSNSGDSLASLAQILSSQPPVQNSTDNWQLPGWRPFHTCFIVFSSQADFQVTTLN